MSVAGSDDLVEDGEGVGEGGEVAGEGGEGVGRLLEEIVEGGDAVHVDPTSLLVRLETILHTVFFC